MWFIKLVSNTFICLIIHKPSKYLVHSLPQLISYEIDLKSLTPHLGVFETCILHAIWHPTPPNINIHNFNKLDKFIAIHSTIILPNISHSGIELFWQSIDFDPGNISTHQLIFYLKFRLLCTVQILFSGWVKYRQMDSSVMKVCFVQRPQESVQRDIQFYQPDFIVLPVNERTKIFPQIYLTVPMFSRTVILMLDVINSKVYFTTIGNADSENSTLNIRSIITIIHATVYKYQEKFNKFKSTTEVVSKNLELMFPFESKWLPKFCFFEQRKTIRNSVPKNQNIWIFCIKEIIRMKLNCTSQICVNVISNQFHFKNSVSVQKHMYALPHGNEFNGIKYSFFYMPANTRNLYALVSPFSLVGWVIAIISFYFVGFTFWLSHFQSHNYFGLLALLLEQDDNIANEINRNTAFLIITWLFAAHILRNEYTSNLFTYMTVEQSPPDLPNNFEEIVKNEPTIILVNGYARFLIQSYVDLVEIELFRKESKIYNLAKLTLKKMWYSSPRPGPLSNIRHRDDENFDVCRAKYGKYIPELCLRRERFAHVYLSGPSDDYQISGILATKLLLKTKYNRIQIIEKNDADLFQSLHLTVTYTNNFLKSTFEKYLAYLIQSGIVKLQKKYLTEQNMRYNVHEINKTTKYSIDKNIFYYISMWQHNNCFSLYRKANCDLSPDKNGEVPVKLADLLTVWILLGGFLIASGFALAYEIVKSKRRP